MNNVILSRFMISLYVNATFLTTMLCLSAFNGTFNADAQVVVVDEPPTNATEELDVKIYATEPLPLNGTIMADIANADDIDIEAIPPEGISVIVTNTTVTVTNSPVDIEAGGDESDTTSIGTEPSQETVEEVEGGVGNDNNDDEETNNDVTEDDA